MPTNLIRLKSVEEFNAGYVPVYVPFFGLLLGKSVAYPLEVGELTLRRLDTVGDIRNARISPKDTEIKQIAVGDKTRTFKKYYKGSQFILSQFQDSQGVDDVTAQCLDEHNRAFDEDVLSGDGQNNGLYTSSDPNYTLEGSDAEIDDTNNDASLISLHKLVMATADKASRVAGRKVVMFYGSDVLPLVSGLYTSSGRSFRGSLLEALGGDYSIATLPSDNAIASGDGWMIINLDQIKFHYTALPQLQKRGINEEKGYAWSNFLQGSSMVEVLALNGIIRQPATLA